MGSFNCWATSWAPLSNYKNYFMFWSWWGGSAGCSCHTKLEDLSSSLQSIYWKERARPSRHCSLISTWMPVFLYLHVVMCVCARVSMCRVPWSQLWTAWFWNLQSQQEQCVLFNCWAIFSAPFLGIFNTAYYTLNSLEQYLPVLISR